MEISILIMTLSSSSIGVNLVFEASSLSIIRLIQYLVSLASFKAIEYLDKKSFLDWANSASAQFAPMQSLWLRSSSYDDWESFAFRVPERRNCLDKIFPASSKCFLLSSI